MTYGMILTGRLVSLDSGHYPQLNSGLDSNKPSSPGVMDSYIANDTGKQYICYISGIWTLVYSEGYEEYQNHLGTTDNFMQTAVSANGTAVTDATNHEMDLSTGITNPSTSRYISKDTFDASANSLISTLKVDNIVSGLPNTKFNEMHIGFMADFAVDDSDNTAEFVQKKDGTWVTRTTNNSGSTTDQSISAIGNGDVLGILVTSNAVLFFKNGSFLNYSITTLPTVNMYAGVGIFATEAGLTTARSCSVDYFRFRQV
jgi:hypothetical protein